MQSKTVSSIHYTVLEIIEIPIQKVFESGKTVKQTVVFLGGWDKCIKVHKISASIIVKKIIKYEENKTKIN